MNTRLKKTIDLGDQEAALELLKLTMRGNDVDTVLKLCESLRYVFQDEAVGFRKKYETSVRDALLWLFKQLDSHNRELLIERGHFGDLIYTIHCFQCDQRWTESGRFDVDPEAMVRAQFYIHHLDLLGPNATRLANLTRLLPNPQPPDIWVHSCEQCVVKGVYGLTDVESTFPHKPECEDLGMQRSELCISSSTIISPTHALRLYVDALMIAKGDDWWDWIWDKANERESYYPSDSNWIMLSSAKVFKDGTIECGPTCPPLPEVD